MCTKLLIKATPNLLTKNDAFEDEYVIGHCSEYHSKEAVERVFQFQNPAFDASSTAADERTKH